MSYTQKFTEGHQPGGELYPALKTPAAYNGAWIRLSNHQRVIFILQVGTMAQTSTLDFLVQEDVLGDGASAAAITGKAITQLTAAGGDGDDLVAIEVRTEELDVDGGFCWVRGVLTVGTANVTCAMLPLRFVANYPPVAVTGWTEVIG